MGGSSCKECLFINESFIIFYFCIDFIESQCYNLQEIKKKKTLMRRVLCGKLPERTTPAEYFAGAYRDYYFSKDSRNRSKKYCPNTYNFITKYHFI